MRINKSVLWSFFGLALVQSLGISGAHAQQSRQVPAYDQAQVRTVLDRSVFYLPLFGAVYRDKFTALIPIEILQTHDITRAWPASSKRR